MKTKIMSIVLMFSLVVAVFGFASPVFASGTPTLEVRSVKFNESVTLRVYNFPADTDVQVRMEAIGVPSSSVIAGVLRTVAGTFDVVIPLPTVLRDNSQISVRFETTAGALLASTTYANSNLIQVTPVVPVTGGSTGGRGPRLNVVGVDENRTVTARIIGMPAYTDFSIKVGPFYGFSKQGEIVGNINSGSNGDITFTVNLPGSAIDVSLLAIRVDSKNGFYAYNSFRNVDFASSGGGSTSDTTSYQPSCSVQSSSPTDAIARNGDFDGTWTIKNTGSTTWEASAIDYKYVGGNNFQSDGRTVFDLPSNVASGDTIKIVIDMKAPSGLGTYSSQWALVKGGTTLCNLNLSLATK